jgi:hypothetical protein
MGLRYECEYSLDSVKSTTINGSEGTVEPFCSGSGRIVQMKLAVPVRLAFSLWRLGCACHRHRARGSRRKDGFPRGRDARTVANLLGLQYELACTWQRRNRVCYHDSSVDVSTRPAGNGPSEKCNKMYKIGFM